jgi:TolB protein
MKRKLFLGFMFIVCMLFGLLSGIVQTQVPTEAQIAFVSTRDGNWEIYVMDADGNNPRNLTNHVSSDRDPSWSPDGQRIVFDSNRDRADNTEIYVMDADGKNSKNLTDHPADDWGAVWSPDGQKIAFSSNRDGNMEIYVMNTDGKNLQRLTKHPATDSFPSWSADSRKIAFNSNRDGNDEIYVIDADGIEKNPRNLTNHLANDWEPAWSSDGRKIAFASWRDGTPKIYIMDADGKNLQRLTDHPAVDQFGHTVKDQWPSWSPDGQSLAFSSSRDGGDRASNFEIYVVDADGADLRRLTNHPAFDANSSWFDPAFTLSVSPSGKLRAIWGQLKQNSN